MPVIVSVLEEFADESTFLRTLRTAMASSRVHGLSALDRLDERIDAHLDGLVLAGAAGEEVVASAGGFPALFVAVRRALVAQLRAAAMRASGGAARDLIIAFGWAPAAEADAVSRELAGPGLEGPGPALRIAVLRAHRRDPGDLIPRAMRSADPAVRAAALRAAGELGRRDLLPALRVARDDDAPECRAWGVWSAALLGDPQAPVDLAAMARAGGSHAARALCLAVRLLPAPAARALVRDVGSSGRPREALAAAAERGDPALVPWILEHIARSDLARLAGDAYAAITGTDLAAAGLATTPPPPATGDLADPALDQDLGVDPDARLTWPHPARVTEHWMSVSGRFTSDVRWLGGRSLDSAACIAALRDQPQATRAGAALDLALFLRDKPLFPVCAPAFRQRRLLASPGGP